MSHETHKRHEFLIYISCVSCLLWFIYVVSKSNAIALEALRGTENRSRPGDTGAV
jgi:hypothetical protein